MERRCAMKRRTLVCRDCGNDHVFFGQTVDQIIASIDSSGWIDRPERNGKNDDTCPDCGEQEERNYQKIGW